METVAEKNQRRLDLHKEIGVALNSIVERETLTDHTTDVLDVLLTHTCEIMATVYRLPLEDAMHCYSQMRIQMQTFIVDLSLREKDDENL